MLLTAGLSLASIPYVPIKADFHNQEPQFEIIGRTLNTPIVRAQFYQGTNYFDPTGLSAYLSFGKDAYSTQMVVVTGVVYAGTTSNTGYADFHISSNTFAYPVNQWYASVMLTDTATAQVYSMAYGYLTIKPAPEVDATHSFFYTRAINGDEYGPFTGSFTNWPFVLSGEFLGGYVAISNWNASNTVLQLQIDVNKTGKVDLVTYTAFAAAQANTNAGFESRIAGEEVKSIAQANTNAGFETRIVANSTGKVSQATYDAHVSAQANTNAGFETRIVANDTGKVSLVTYNLHTAAQANTNAGFESRIAGEEVKSTAQVNTNAGFESRIGIEEGKSTAQANTNAGFETRITDNSTGKVSLVTYTAHAAAQVNTNAGFESRIAGEEVKSTAQANTNAAFETRIQEGEEAYSWGDHADEGYLTAGTNLFDEMTIAKRSMLGANLSGLTQGVYTGVASSVSFTGVTELVYGRTYAWGFTKQNAYGTSTLSIASYSLVATAAGAASNYFTFIGTDTNLVLKLDGDGSSKSDVSAVYVRQITGGVANVASDLRVGGDIILDGAILDFSDFVTATITNDLSGRVDVLSTSKVSHTDPTYTSTVAKAVAAYDWGDHAEEGYLTNEPSWTAASGSVVYVTDSTYTDTVAKAAAAYPSSNSSNFVDATITNDLSGRVDVLSTSKVSHTDSIYTDTVAKAAAAVTTNDTRQLDFTGADILIADATKTNHPVTKSQLDANSGTTNATGINVAFTPTNYTPDSADVEGHLIGIDAVVASGSGSGFPLTNNGDLAGFNLTNGGLVQAVSGEFDYVDIGIQLRMTNSESAGALEVVDAVIDAEIDDLYYARRNGGWSNISWLLDLGDATNALNTRVGVLETSTNALNTRMGAVETATGSLNTAVGNLNNSTNALNAKVVALNNSTNALNTRVGKLEGSTNAMNTRLGSLEVSTNAINAVANAALPKTATNALSVTALQITGGSPSNGAIWIATNTSGQGGWNSFVAFNAHLTNANFLYTNATGRSIQFSDPFGNIRYNYGSAFDGTQFTAPVSGWYAFSFVCRWTRAFGTAGASDFHIRKNDNIIGSRTIEGGQEGGVSFGAIGTEYYLAKGDSIDIYVIGRAGTTNSVGDTSGRFTVFSGHLVRALPE
jgi:hypothetical protein